MTTKYRVVACLGMFDTEVISGVSLRTASERAAHIREHGLMTQENDTSTHYPVHRIQSVRVEPLP
jgi:hypothetical protein